MIQVEEFTQHEVEPLVRMWRKSFEYGVGITDTNPIEAQIDYFWKEIAHTNRVRLAKTQGQIVGVVASNSESVNLLYVRVGFHRRGIGKQLLQLAKAESCGSLWLYTFARNKVACTFYESQGFVVVQRGFEPFWQLEDVKFNWSRGEA
jgi:GNAT superfamily N-acetyltransferase